MAWTSHRESKYEGERIPPKAGKSGKTSKGQKTIEPECYRQTGGAMDLEITTEKNYNVGPFSTSL